MNLETRNVEIGSFDPEERTITGLAAPYGQVADIGSYQEAFERGAFGQPDDVKLFYGHTEPIGKIVRSEDTDEGFSVTAKISKTARGNEVYELLKDGVLNRFSVGFLPGKHEMRDGVLYRTAVALKEVSVVPFPAYEGASISEVRSENTNKEKEDINMSNENEFAPASDVADLRGAVEEMERRFTVMENGNGNTGSKAVEYRNGGEFLKALASGSQEARDFATTVEADVTRPAWVSEPMRMALENRTTINLFSKGALPATGNSIEYPRLASVAGTVQEQVNEGDALAYMEVALDTATAQVKTYGGYSSLSRQAIERSDLAYLQTVLEYQTRQYAKATNAVVRDALEAHTGFGTVAALAADDAEGWIDFVIDASASIEDNSMGARAEFVLVGRDVFKRLARMVDAQGRPLFGIAGQSVNSLGSANLVTATLNIGGLPVVVDHNLAANSTYVASSSAIKTWESAGAPFRLQDENIINLTKDFSLYGYMASAVLNDAAIVKGDVDLTA